jgi:hypothetical protein
MKKLSLTVSASLLAIAGCGAEPIHTNPGPQPTNPVPSAEPVAAPSASATTDVSPKQIPAPEPIHVNPGPREIPSAAPSADAPKPPKYTNSKPH